MTNDAPEAAQPPTRRSRSGGGGAPAAPSKAGRDLKAAIGIGVLLAVVALGSLLFVKELFLVLVLLVMAVGVWELSRALQSVQVRVPIVPVLIGGAAMIVVAYYRGAEAQLIALGLTVVGVLLWRVADGVTGALRDVSAGAFTALYPCFLGAFVALLLAAPDGHLRVIFFILVTVFSDIGGYAVGVLVGKHPMAPSISPKKSWEGFAGSVLTCALIGSVAMWQFWPEATWWHGTLIGAAAAALATVGDFIESSIKRDLGIKDMSSLLPGHGGVMDRIDSLVMTAPLLWLTLAFAVPIA
ncbi:phosphatidate cytidylyltransferase [Nostocoides sp. F2B08]|uniref:phosphatidate cytidylyltransferase n=1 Tax=Nostocoides sp. F2B08 TaxID=2653936 RepID=UPI00126369D1|nr:phosphatidate cytidylyltransferase [Tetrasphaera sp. F2B08]KAB7746033.1 phosphatidate cytidylyltransferase [Tetrasphaera sp. F2B08]